MKFDVLNSLAKNSIDDISIQDWRQYPVWTETGNWHNEDEIAPLLNSHELSYRSGVYYVFSEIFLENKLQFEGFIRISEGNITVIAFFVEQNLWIDHPLVEHNRRLFSLTEESLANQLNLKVHEVFPISYECLAGFADMPKLTGIIEK